MKSALAALLIASVAHASGAMSFSYKARLLNPQDQVRWEADGGVVFDQPSYAKLELEMKRLQTVEQSHLASPSPRGWFFGGMIAGALASTLVAALIYFIAPSFVPRNP